MSEQNVIELNKANIGAALSHLGVSKIEFVNGGEEINIFDGIGRLVAVPEGICEFFYSESRNMIESHVVSICSIKRAIEEFVLLIKCASGLQTTIIDCNHYKIAHDECDPAFAWF